jgi:Menaquinone biosynthesis
VARTVLALEAPVPVEDLSGSDFAMSVTKQLIRVGHSPDPDDAFMFHALANDKIETGDYDFRHELVDIETLNRRAFSSELELTAVSLHAYAYLTDRYLLCPCGASMGDGYGPMVVARGALSLEALGDADYGLSRLADVLGSPVSLCRRAL